MHKEYNKMTNNNITLIKNIKPFMNNLIIQCMIIQYIDDPPDHINNIEKYHYHVADKSGSAILCIPHFFMEDELKKNKINNYSHQNLEDVVDCYDPESINVKTKLTSKTKEKNNEITERELGINKKELNLNRNSNKNIIGIHMNKNESTDYSSINNMYNNKSESGGFLTNVKDEDKKNEHSLNLNANKVLKYLFRIGDQIKIFGAITTWSMGKMVLMPSTRTDKNKKVSLGMIYKIGFFNMEINLEPNVSNLIVGSTEKKYKEEGHPNNSSDQQMSTSEEIILQADILKTQMKNGIITNRKNDVDKNRNINVSSKASNRNHRFLKKVKKSKYDISFLL